MLKLPNVTDVKKSDFLVKGRKTNWYRIINKGKLKEERNKTHCKKKESGCRKLNFFQKWKNKNKI